jgi:N-acetylglucosaminyldiphosphoundecaprenol N-acetyl-beta-D-mannosaminyltransferase
MEEALASIETLVGAGAGGAVFTPNADHVVMAEDDVAFRAAYHEARLSLADGQSLVWASRALGAPLPEKVSGSDLVWPLMQRAARRRWRVYLLGGAPGAAATAADRFRRELGVEVVGVDPAHIRVDGADGSAGAAAERVRATRPQLVLVALGAPKQELWIHAASARLGPTVAIGVGATLDFISGRARRAPRWTSRSGLEWLYRLAHDPRRLAGRYLLRDPRLVAVLLRTAALPRPLRVRDAATHEAPPLRMIPGG